jgi:hypothetical protein
MAVPVDRDRSHNKGADSELKESHVEEGIAFDLAGPVFLYRAKWDTLVYFSPGVRNRLADYPVRGLLLRATRSEACVLWADVAIFRILPIAGCWGLVAGLALLSLAVAYALFLVEPSSCVLLAIAALSGVALGLSTRFQIGGAARRG